MLVVAAASTSAMPSRKTVLNWSERANFAPKDIVTPSSRSSRSPLLDLPAIRYSRYALAGGIL